MMKQPKGVGRGVDLGSLSTRKGLALVIPDQHFEWGTWAAVQHDHR